MSELPNSKSPLPNHSWKIGFGLIHRIIIFYIKGNYREAQLFMDNLTLLNLPEKAKVLDLACGKGRHAIYLNKLGFDVLGVDLSENSIAEANKNANESLHFEVHDMQRFVAFCWLVIQHPKTSNLICSNKCVSSKTQIQRLSQASSNNASNVHE